MIDYRSGDISYAIALNTLVYQGRRDDQVKINGYRIELCEVEQALLGVPQVGSVVAAVIDDVQGQYSGLLACATPLSVDVATVMQHLRQQLSTYMRPKQRYAITQLPLSHNGKVGVRQMVVTVRNTAPASGGERLGNAMIGYSVRVCVEGALEQAEFDDNENLYVSGLDFIKSIQIAAQLRRHSWTMSVVQVVECGTVNAICEFLTSHTAVSQPAWYAHNTRIDLPALHWFTQLALPVPNVCNHVIVLKVLLSYPLEQLHSRLHTLIRQQSALHNALDAEGRLLVCGPNVYHPNEMLMGYSTAQWVLAEAIAQHNNILGVTNG